MKPNIIRYLFACRVIRPLLQTTKSNRRLCFLQPPLNSVFSLVNRDFVAMPCTETPGIHLQWQLTDGNIETKTDSLIAKTKTVYDAVGALKAGEITYDNTIKVIFFI